jgi:hypothetical protein
MSFTTITGSGSVGISATQTAITSLTNANLFVGYSTSAGFDFTSTTIGVDFGSVEDFRFTDGGEFWANGNIIAYSGSISSDIKLKKNLRPINNALSKLETLTGYEYQMRRDDSDSAGLIAQEVEKVLPCAVSTVEAIGDSEEHLTLNYNSVIGLLVQAVKELKAEVEELKNGNT